MTYRFRFMRWALGLVVLVLACEDAEPNAPAAPRVDDAASTLAEFLADPLFQAILGGIDEPTITVPLRAGFDGLAHADRDEGRYHLAAARSAAGALADAPEPDFDTQLAWSVIELVLDHLEAPEKQPDPSTTPSPTTPAERRLP